jgi:hypothetical protein
VLNMLHSPNGIDDLTEVLQRGSPLAVHQPVEVFEHGLHILQSRDLHGQAFLHVLEKSLCVVELVSNMGCACFCIVIVEVNLLDAMLREEHVGSTNVYIEVGL